MSYSWPNISNPVKYKPIEVNNTISSPFEAGYKQTRPRFTRVPKSYRFSWNAMSDADVALLKTLWDSVNCHTAFTWTQLLSGATKTVRFASPPEWEKNGELPFHWSVEVTLEEV